MSPKPSPRDPEALSREKKLFLQSQPHGVKDRIGHFTWANFTCTMSTAAIAVVLSQQPFTFDGLNVIGKVFFILDLVLLSSFITIITARYIWQPWKFLKSLHYPQEALFFGSFWVTIGLVLNCIQQYGVPSCGPWLVRAVEIMFWIYASCSLLVAIFQYLTLFVEEKMPVSSAMPTWIFPVYPFLVMGPLAAVVIPSQQQDAALAIFVGAVTFQGLGWIVSMFMYGIYVARLMANELPPPPKRPGVFISVGPAGYTSAAFISLGRQAPSVVPQGFLGLPEFDVGAAIMVVGVMTGVFVWLVGFLFFAHSLGAVLIGARKMSFTLNWWAFIFPNAGLTLALIEMGNVLKSTGIKAVSSAMTILLVVAWVIVAGSNISAFFRRQIYWTGKDEDDGMGE